MASYTELEEFAKTRRLDRAGIYVIEPDLVQNAPIKLGMTGNIMRRMQQYKRAWPWGFKILALARTVATPGTQGIQTRRAERFMKQELGVDVKMYQEEYINPNARTRTINALLKAHNAFSGKTPLWDNVWLAEDIQNPDRPNQPPTTLPPTRRLRYKQPPQRLESAAPQLTSRVSTKTEVQGPIKPDTRRAPGLSEAELRGGIINRPRQRTVPTYSGP